MLSKLTKKQKYYLIIGIIFAIIVIASSIVLYIVIKPINNNKTNEPVMEKFSFLLDVESIEIKNEISIEEINSISIPFEKLTEEEAISYKGSKNLFIDFKLVNNSLSFVGLLPNETKMDIILLSTRGNAYSLAIKEKSQKIKDNINLSSLPKGRYYLYINLNNEKYNTTEFVVLK